VPPSGNREISQTHFGNGCNIMTVRAKILRE
jgi:hypothetical protein